MLGISPTSADETSYDREAALPPKERRIYLSNLQGKYEDFKAKKQAMTREEFEAWFAKTLQDHDEARKQAGSLSEYLWLKTTRKLNSKGVSLLLLSFPRC